METSPINNTSLDDAPRKGSLLVIFLTVFIDLLGFGIVIPLLPIYADELALDESGWQLGALRRHSPPRFRWARCTSSA